MAYAAEILVLSFSDERRAVLTEHSDSALKIVWKQGWIDEATAWLKAREDLESSEE